MIALILCAVITLFALSSCNSFDALLGENDAPSVNTDATGGAINSTDESDSNATGDETPTEKPTDAPIDRDAHTDEDNDGSCDDCGISVIITFDFYALNDLHGKFDDTDSQGGVDELSTYLANAYRTDDNVQLL